MAEETDPRVAAYFRCLGSAIEAEERREIAVTTPRSVAPPSVRCIEWVDALEKAWAALCTVLRCPEIKDDPALDMDIESLMVKLDEKAVASAPERASTEKLSHAAESERVQQGK